MWENERWLSLLTKETQIRQAQRQRKCYSVLFYVNATSEIMHSKDSDGNILRNQMETKCIHLFQSSALIVLLIKKKSSRVLKISEPQQPQGQMSEIVRMWLVGCWLRRDMIFHHKFKMNSVLLFFKTESRHRWEYKL